ncbi:unnamed protein product [Moneuplotes crassus]|uniref:F-box domain-containing protein n=1 Tax=Euplotes crassus TaxID=5936 RepID=A0AAD2D093_EUPCR|nr:unnamed protein product [Moneuplotes crassus]
MKDSPALKELKSKTSVLWYLSYFMDIETINKMLLLNKWFYDIYSNDIVWNNVFHQNFTKLRIIDDPQNMSKNISAKNQLGKKRKRFISAVKNARKASKETFTPNKEDCYTVIISGLLEYMPVETAIKDIYGPCQDMFCFFNCFFFSDEKISLLCSYFTPHQLSTHSIRSTDCFLFPFNRNFPWTFKEFDKIKTLVEEKKCQNVMILENTHIPEDMEALADTLDSDELDQVKQELEKPQSEKFPEIDEFASSNPDIPYLKIDICSNHTINQVFYSLIKLSSKSKKEIDINGQLMDEKDVEAMMKAGCTQDALMKSKEEINNEYPETEETKKKKCTIF